LVLLVVTTTAVITAIIIAVKHVITTSPTVAVNGSSR